MGTFSVSIDYPDEEEARIMNALKQYWVAHDQDGNEVKPKTADIKTMVRGMVAQQLRDLVFRVEREQAVAQAVAGLTPPNIT